MSGECVDLVVVGAGPGGVSAAVCAAECGLNVVLLDRYDHAGGQIHRALSVAQREHAPGHFSSPGDALRARLRSSTVRHVPRATVWNVEPGPSVHWRDATTLRRTSTRALILATGASETVPCIPGGTLPGVFGLAAATILLKQDGRILGASPVLAGAGPLLYLLAAAYLKHGVRPAAIVDRASIRSWAATLPRLAATPAEAARGAFWYARVRWSGVPIYHEAAVVRVEGAEQVERVIINGPGLVGAVTAIPAEALALGVGLSANSHATQVAGAAHEFDASLMSWLPLRTPNMETTVPNVYAVGECAGISGSRIAIIEGEVAALDVAAHLLPQCRRQINGRLARARRRLLRARISARAVGTMIRFPDTAEVRSLDSRAIVCRCEDVTVAELLADIDAGAVDLHELKMRTRCGMGPCQGKICAPWATAIMATRTGRPPGEIAAHMQRPPIEPLPISIATAAWWNDHPAAHDALPV